MSLKITQNNRTIEVIGEFNNFNTNKFKLHLDFKLNEQGVLAVDIKKINTTTSISFKRNILIIIKKISKLFVLLATSFITGLKVHKPHRRNSIDEIYREFARRKQDVKYKHKSLSFEQKKTRIIIA
jgi:hypothetical protein